MKRKSVPKVNGMKSVPNNLGWSVESPHDNPSIVDASQIDNYSFMDVSPHDQQSREPKSKHQNTTIFVRMHFLMFSDKRENKKVSELCAGERDIRQECLG